MKTLLELFKGTGSVGKVAKKMGYNVISVDMEEKYKPTYVTDILDFDYKSIPTPDIIWASPPCNTYSLMINMNTTNRPRKNHPPFTALTEQGKTADKVVKRTLEIISYFKQKNPKLKWIIENPDGFLKQMPFMKGLPMTTTTYCMYGDRTTSRNGIKGTRWKPTNFWNNFDLKLKPRCTHNINKEPYHTPKSLPHISIMDTKNLDERYKIPSKLIKEMLTQASK